MGNDPHGHSHGFCLLSNVAIAAGYAMNVYRRKGRSNMTSCVSSCEDLALLDVAQHVALAEHFIIHWWRRAHACESSKRTSISAVCKHEA